MSSFIFCFLAPVFLFFSVNSYPLGFDSHLRFQPLQVGDVYPEIISYGPVYINTFAGGILSEKVPLDECARCYPKIYDMPKPVMIEECIEKENFNMKPFHVPISGPSSKEKLGSLLNMPSRNIKKKDQDEEGKHVEFEKNQSGHSNLWNMYTELEKKKEENNLQSKDQEREKYSSNQQVTSESTPNETVKVFEIINNWDQQKLKEARQEMSKYEEEQEQSFEESENLPHLTSDVMKMVDDWKNNRKSTTTLHELGKRLDVLNAIHHIEGSAELSGETKAQNETKMQNQDEVKTEFSSKLEQCSSATTSVSMAEGMHLYLNKVRTDSDESSPCESLEEINHDDANNTPGNKKIKDPEGVEKKSGETDMHLLKKYTDLLRSLKPKEDTPNENPLGLTYPKNVTD